MNIHIYVYIISKISKGTRESRMKGFQELYLKLLQSFQFGDRTKSIVPPPPRDYTKLKEVLRVEQETPIKDRDGELQEGQGRHREAEREGSNELPTYAVDEVLPLPRRVDGLI